MSEEQPFRFRPGEQQGNRKVWDNFLQAVQAEKERLFAADTSLELVVRPYRRRRSLAQNRCLHGWCKIIADFVEEHHGDRIMPEAWKEWFKAQVLGQTEVEMPDGTIRAITKPSSKVTVEEFKELLDYMDRWCAERLQLELPRTEDYWEAMGGRRAA
jgi:hypothetical protein